MDNNPNPDLELLGFDPWFLEQAEDPVQDPFEIARVTAVHKDAYTISNGRTSVNAEITGKLMFTAESHQDYPVVGDWVVAQFLDENTFGIVHDILSRKTTLMRKTPGKKIDHQLIGANIDTAIVVQALDDDFNLRRLERYLVMIYDGNIHPLVLLSKRDLLPAAEIEQKVKFINDTYPDLTVATLSNLEESGLDEINGLLESGKTYCLLGSSGVGKTTLLNNFLGKAEYETAAVREKDSKGRHTTTQRQLVRLENGAMIVDTPGMRELGFVGMESGIQDTFSEIEALADQCRYRDCSHTQEEGCAVISAVEEGNIQEERYQNYLKVQKESSFNEMSYLEKRQKDRQFGKMIKTVLKHSKK